MPCAPQKMKLQIDEFRKNIWYLGLVLSWNHLSLRGWSLSLPKEKQWRRSWKSISQSEAPWRPLGVFCPIKPIDLLEAPQQSIQTPRIVHRFFGAIALATPKEKMPGNYNMAQLPHLPPSCWHGVRHHPCRATRIGSSRQSLPPIRWSDVPALEADGATSPKAHA